MAACEWNPTEERPALLNDEPHAEATLSVGTGRNNIHLCPSCAELSTFARLRRRVPLKRPPREGCE